MTSQVQAHGISLPLHYFLQKVEDAGPEEASTVLLGQVRSLGLQEDLSVVIVFNRGTKVSFEALTEYGKMVLAELTDRGEFVPCPVSECEFVSSCCKWCGSMKDL